MSLNKSILSKLEELSMLKLTDDERLDIAKELEKMIDLIAVIKAYEPEILNSHKRHLDEEESMREDICRKAMQLDKVFLNTKNRKANYFKVPKVINRNNG